MNPSDKPIKRGVINRKGILEPLSLDKITERLRSLSADLDQDYVDVNRLIIETVSGYVDGMTTREIDSNAAEHSVVQLAQHPDYGVLASRIEASSMHRDVPRTFSEAVEILYRHVHPRLGINVPLVSEELYDIVRNHREVLDAAIVPGRDFDLSYFSIKRLQKSYLIQVKGKLVESPQYMWMRVSIGIHGADIPAVLETYDLMSRKFFIHATPTLYNAGTRRPQMSSCFLVPTREDSIEGIYDTLKQCAIISKTGGGIGVDVSNVRCAGSYIAGSNGTSSGLVPMLQNFNATARYVDQGGNKRPGAIAAYCQAWHGDFPEFIELRLITGNETSRTRSLFTAVVLPDLFMKRLEIAVSQNKEVMWSMFCPHECPELYETWGDEFEAHYLRYEQEGKAVRQMPVQKLFKTILSSQVESGLPYVLYKDACNRSSNHKHLGTLQQSNLCMEILEYSVPDEVAVCNLASLSIAAFVVDGKFDHDLLHRATQVLTRNLNKVIDRNYYPIPETRRSNMRHRPIGIGIQGLATAFFKLRLPFESDAAAQLNREVMETIYHASLTASCALARESGSTYDSYPGSPLSQGILNHDFHKVAPSPRWDWDTLRQNVKLYGAKNSLLVALMPTATTSHILGNTECFDPITSNLYTRRVLSGEFVVANPYLYEDLIRLGLWNEKVKKQLHAKEGSIQDIPGIPLEIKELYKTAYEIPQKRVIDMAADRLPWVCQSQSLTIWMRDATANKLASMHNYGWKKGLKTGMYYLRNPAKQKPPPFTVVNHTNPNVEAEDAPEPPSGEGLSTCEDDEGCVMCQA